LPYFERGSVYNKNMAGAVWQDPIGEYFCPSRRRVTRQADRVLMDYASATPAVNPNNIGFGTEGDLWQGEIWTVPTPREWHGAIVRTPVTLTGGLWTTNNSTQPGGFESVIDGTSYVLFVAEKRLARQNYFIGDWHDDRGWTDGWDPDVVRCTCVPPQKDAESGVTGYEFGSAHPAGMQSLFGDGSVKTITWQVDPNTFNRMGDRQDRRPVNIE
jgi:hypothetical protein